MDEKKYFNQKLWFFDDKYITTNCFDVNTSFSVDGYSISPMSLQFMIRNYKQNVYNFLNLYHQNIYKFLLKFKTINNNLNELINKITSDPTTQENFSIKIMKKTLRFSLLYRNEYDVCCCIVISEKDQNFSDNEKIFIPIYDFLSLIQIMVDFRDSYFSISSNNYLIYKTNQIEEQFESIQSELFNCRVLLQNNQKNKVEEDVSVKEKDDNFNFQEQKDFDSFLEQNLPEQNLPKDIQKEFEIDDQYRGSNPDVVEDLISYPISEYILNNDFSNMETMLASTTTASEPLLVTIINNLDSFENIYDLFTCNNDDVNKLLFISSCYMKEVIRKFISESSSVPNNSIPFIVESELDGDKKKSLFYEFYSYLVYLNIVSNQLLERDKDSISNKVYYSFIFKTCIAPFVFSHINENLNKQHVLSQVKNCFSDLCKKGVFTNYEQKIEDEYQISLNLQNFNEISEKIYDLIIEKKNELSIDKIYTHIFDQKIITISLENFNKFSLTEEQIQNLIYIQFVNSFEQKDEDIDLPSELIYQRFPDLDKTGVLKKYIRSNYKSQEELDLILDIIDTIKTSYKEIEGNFNYSFLNENILKALCLWDINLDPKIQNDFMYFKSKVEESNLDKSKCLSLLTNNDDVQNIDNYTTVLKSQELNI